MTEPHDLSAERAHRVIVVGDGPLATQLERALSTDHRTRLVDPRGLSGVWADAVATLEGVDVVVFAHFDAAALVERQLSDTTPDDWTAATRGTLDAVRELTVLASAALHESRGHLVFVLPNIAMTGAAGWVPLATAAEGVRSWAKSVARQWAGAVAVNCITTTLPLVLGDGSKDPVPELIGAGFTADTPPDVADVLAALDALTGPLGSRLVGATVTVDGGVHMEA